MIRKKYRIMLVGLAFLLAVICGAYFPDSPVAFAGEEAGETLTIKGDGVTKEITFSRQELERMTEARERHIYSATNNFPTDKLFYREGISLDYLLKLAGIKDSAKQLKFISSDGYTRTFTRKELLEDLRYSFDKDNKNVVVKALDKEEASLNKYTGLTLYKVSIKPTYGRISSKQLISNIQNYYDFDFRENKMYKFACSWNQEQKFLTIYLDKEVQG